MEKIYRQMIKQAPSQLDIYLELAALYIKQGKDDAAVDILEEATGKVDNPLDMLRVLGGLYMKQSADKDSGKNPRRSRNAAMRTFGRVLEAQTNDVSILFQMGLLCIQDQQPGKALEYFTRIEELNPENLQIRQRLAMSFAEAGGKDEAIASLRALLEKDSGNARIYYYLGELYTENGDTTNALLNFSLAATNAPADPAPFIKKAIIQVENDPEMAKQSLAEGLTRLPGDPRLTEMIGYVFFSEKKYDKAIEYFGQALESVEKANPGSVNPTLYYNYAIARQKAGQIPETAALLGKAMDKNPAYLDAYLQYAFRQQDDAGLRQSIAVLEAVGSTRQDEPSVYVYLGILNSYLKSFKAAIAAFEKAESLVEDSPQQNDVLDASFYFWYAAACERDRPWRLRAEIRCRETNLRKAKRVAICRSNCSRW